MPDWIRTNDLLLRKQTLYPTELRAHVWIFQTKNRSHYPPEMKMNIALSATLILYHIYNFMNRENPEFLKIVYHLCYTPHAIYNFT